MNRHIFLAKWLHRLSAKRLSRPEKGFVFLPPDFVFSNLVNRQILPLKANSYSIIQPLEMRL